MIEREAMEAAVRQALALYSRQLGDFERAVRNEERGRFLAALSDAAVGVASNDLADRHQAFRRLMDAFPLLTEGV